MRDLNIRDLNNNGIDDLEEIKSLTEKVKDWFKTAWNYIKTHKVVIILSVLLCFSLATRTTINGSVQVNTVEPKTDEVSNILKEDLEKGDFKINLNNLVVTKVRETTSRKTNKSLFVVYREDKSQNVFLTIFEEVDNLNYNKEQYLKYIEENSKPLDEKK